MDRPLGVAGKAVIRDGDRILLLQRSATSGHDPGLWELPGGKIDYGEELVVALRREVREETGLAIAVGQPLVTWHFVKGPFWVTGVTFVCELTDGRVDLSGEHDDHAWIEPSSYVRYPLATAVEEQLRAYTATIGA